MPETWDVVIIGAGPAGCRAAAAAAQTGARVLLLDRKRRLGALPHCAEYVPRALGLELDIPPRARVQAVEGMETRLAGRRRFSPVPGWMLDRQVFDHHLALLAARAGAVVRAATRFLGREGQLLILRRSGRLTPVRAGAVVAADGAASPTARAWGLGPPRLLAGVQLEVPLARPLQRTLVFLHPRFRHGYAWLFPKGPAANLGLGCLPAAGPRRLLEDLRRRLLAQGLIRRGVLAAGGGAIPVDGPRPALARNRLILAGDAAGLTHPVTGAGIPQALFSGHLAGRAAARLAGGDPKAAPDYQAEVLARYRRYLERGLAARHHMEAAWDHELFPRLMARTWPGWKEQA